MNVKHKYCLQNNLGMVPKVLDLPEARALVRKARQCPCCGEQGPVVKIVHSDGRVETSVLKKEVTEEMMTKWSNFPLLD